MTVFAVYQGKAQTTEVVAEKFSWLAFLLPPVFALVHGLWLELIGFAGLVALLAVLGSVAGPDAAMLTYLAAALLIGFEASALRGGALRRSGHLHRGDFVAPAADLAELEWEKRRTTAA